MFPSLAKTRPSHTAATPAATPPLPDAAVPPGGGGAAPVSSAKDKDRGGLSGSAAGTDALPQAMGKGGAPAAAETKGSSRGGGSELWIVGRVLEDMDTRLGAKQEKIRTLRDLEMLLYLKRLRGYLQTLPRCTSYVLQPKCGQRWVWFVLPVRRDTLYKIREAVI